VAEIAAVRGRLIADRLAAAKGDDRDPGGDVQIAIRTSAVGQAVAEM